MPRPLVVGNGKFLVNLDDRCSIRDIYYPYVGQVNHVGGYRCRTGLWADGRFSWLEDAAWRVRPAYAEDSLVTEVEACHDSLGLTLRINDAVHQRENIFLRRVQLRNEADKAREIRIFFHQDLAINETEVGDTAAFYPDNRTLFHYKKNSYFMFNGLSAQADGTTAGIYEYTTGIKRFHQAEGTWKDAEDGHLMGNPIAQGSVDSTFSLRLIVPGGETREAYYWFSAGSRLEEVKRLDRYVADSHPGRLIDRVRTYWQRWANKRSKPFADLEPDLVRLYKQSLLAVRSQTDVNGAIIAANDTDIMQFNRDHYSYMWPRDGALVAQAMSAAGYHGMIAPFFRFCADALTEDGYLLHKYNPDGTVGSSWHPYLHDGQEQLPIQEDETALVLHALWQDYELHEDIELPQSLYRTFIRKAAHFLLEYCDDRLGLPRPSYDLWEERYGIFAFTSAAVYGGLTAAARFAALFGDDERSNAYARGAEEIKAGMLRHLWNEEHGRFARGLHRVDGQWRQDMTPESSIFGIYAFGVLPPDDPRVASTMRSLREALSVRSATGGIARYWGDYYFQRCSDMEVAPGNPWIICTLWFACYDIATATSLEQLVSARRTLRWVADHSLPSGLLPEQLDPYDGSPVSVAPLTWSHATYIDTVLKYVAKYEQLQASQACS